MSEINQDDLVRIIAKATREIMNKTGDPFEVAVKKAKEGLKQYIDLRVETTKQLMDAGYSKDYAFERAKQLVSTAFILSDA